MYVYVQGFLISNTTHADISTKVEELDHMVFHSKVEGYPQPFGRKVVVFERRPSGLSVVNGLQAEAR